MIHVLPDLDSFQEHRPYEPTYEVAKIAITPAGMERVWALMQGTAKRRYEDWRQRHEYLERDRSYRLPRIHELYARALITEPQRDALHVTRKVIDALMHNTITGRSGMVAEWTKVHNSFAKTVLDEIKADPQTAGERSLVACIQILRQNSYDMPEGVYRFVRTPLALRELERKYYLEDLATY